ncbi:MAG TPA: two-component regulator propeller domain-containing protein [Sphingobacterium sp.]|nr:two-component regulator propeller domain-containing protein [Sphingobacterium sp.]
MFRFYLSVSVVILFFCPRTAAQDYRIQKLGVENGLSSNYIVSITQDKEDFLWFATEHGLNRFDGIRTISYKKAAGDNSISANELNKIYADPEKDVIWIATQRKGLNKLDYHTGEITTYQSKKDSPASLITNDVTDISPSKDGKSLWVATFSKGVEYFDKEKETFQHFNKSTVSGFGSDLVWTVKEDSKGYVYIGHVDSGLSILSPDRKKVKHFKHDRNNPSGLPGDVVRCIYEDNTGNMWIGTNNGLALYRSEKEDFIVFKHDPRRSSSLPANYIYAIFQLADGRLCVGTEKGGLSILNIHNQMFMDPSEVKLQNIPYSDDPYGLSNPTVRSIFQDSFQNIWIATYGGGVNFIGHREPFFSTWAYVPFSNRGNVLNNAVAWGLVADDNNKLWIGTDGGGINVFNAGKRVQILDKANGQLKDNAILAAMKDRDGDLWFGTFDGYIYVFDPSGKRKAEFQIVDRTADVRSIYQDKTGNIWIGSTSGLYRYNKKDATGKLEKPEANIHLELVRAISEDNNGLLWLGFFGQGLFILDKDLHVVTSHTIHNGLPSNTINHIYKARNGSMWVATSEGLMHFVDKDHATLYGEENGLQNQDVRAITEDSIGNIWISTNSGICRLDQKTRHFYCYGHHFGIPTGDFMAGSVAQDHNGKIFFGSQNGVSFFDPLSIPTNIQFPSPVLTSFKIFPANPGVSSQARHIPVAEMAQLRHNENTFEVSFSVLDYALSPLVEYACMLEGLENTWHTLEGNNIMFRNVPHGQYKLLVKSRINSHPWTDKILSLDIVVSPPFWLSWWAKTLYTIVGAAIIFLIIRFYKRKLALENSLLLQQIQYRQEQALHEERTRFFTNVTHELRTPLTLITGPLEDILQEQALPAPVQTKLGIMRKSTDKLVSLVNQLLDFQKVDDNSRKLIVQHTDIVPVINEIGLKYKESSLNKPYHFEVSLQEESMVLYFDADVVSTILDNILSNAFKYTYKGSIELSLKKVVIDDVEYAQIAVNDTGIGIPEEEIHKIFDRYYQAGHNKYVSGTGIGLALTQRLIQLHQAQLKVESKPHIGSTFTVLLDMSHMYPDAVHTEITTRIPTESKHEPDGTSYEEDEEQAPIVLVIEDNFDILDYIDKSLQENYQVLLANNGKEGLQKAITHIPDIIVSDIMMPEMDGYALLSILKSDIRTSHIPVIFLTAKDSTADRKKGYDMGVDSYLVKPFNSFLLTSRILNILENRKKISNNFGSSLSKQDAAATPENMGLTQVDQEFLEKLRAIIIKHILTEKIDVKFLAENVHMSHSTLYRKIKGVSGINVNEYIRTVRIQYAKELLTEGKYSISEVASMVGINSVPYFKQCFKEQFGISATEYAKCNQ